MKSKLFGRSNFTVTYTLQPPDIEQLATWNTGIFCKNYIGHALFKPIIMCRGDIMEIDMLKCFVFQRELPWFSVML